MCGLFLNLSPKIFISFQYHSSLELLPVEKHNEFFENYRIVSNFIKDIIFLFKFCMNFIILY